SMVRADLLDMIERITREVFLKSRKKADKERASLPFAGIQLLFVGDLYQLPPVLKSTEKEWFSSLYNSPYFFSAQCYSSLQMKMYELTKIYRQNDKVFVDILNRIRNGMVNEEDMRILNERYDPYFEPGDKQYVYLTTHNDIVDEINQRELAKLPSGEQIYRGKIQGEFSEKEMPTEEELVLKKGAQVMFLTNEPSGAWVNGTIGRVVACGKDVVEVELEDGTEVDVTPYTWTSYRYESLGKNEVKKIPIGSFIQFPLRLAWSITVHKSQGKTFSHVILDMNRGAFASGQTYVALSRVTSLEGLVLKHPLKKSHIKVDYRIVHFMRGSRDHQIGEMDPIEEKRSLLQKAIDEKKPLEMVYLKPDDTESRRVILPLFVGTMEYHGKTFEGLRAFCQLTGGERTFRLDRILEIHDISSHEEKT
ncbi:MAG: WYL domain-containing protein, partial [Brevinematales bacterium]